MCSLFGLIDFKGVPKHPHKEQNPEYPRKRVLGAWHWNATGIAYNF